jgi:hypothetical protein
VSQQAVPVLVVVGVLGTSVVSVLRSAGRQQVRRDREAARTRAAAARPAPPAPVQRWHDLPTGIEGPKPRTVRGPMSDPATVARFRGEEPPAVRPARRPAAPLGVPGRTPAEPEDEVVRTVEVPRRLFVAAANLVVSTEYGSAAMVGRELGVAGEMLGLLMEGLEAAGVVGPGGGSGLREVLVDRAGLGAVFARLGIPAEPEDEVPPGFERHQW